MHLVYSIVKVRHLAGPRGGPASGWLYDCGRRKARDPYVIRILGPAPDGWAAGRPALVPGEPMRCGLDGRRWGWVFGLDRRAGRNCPAGTPDDRGREAHTQEPVTDVVQHLTVLRDLSPTVRPYDLAHRGSHLQS